MKPLPAKIFSEEIFRAPHGINLFHGLVTFLCICAILFFGQEILIPIVLACFLSILLAPCVRALQKLKIPRVISISAVVILTFAVLLAIAGVVATSVTNLAGDLPQYESNLRAKAKSFKLATSGGTTVEKAANVLKDLQTELNQPNQTNNPQPSIQPSILKPIPVEIRPTSLGPLDPVISVMSIVLHPLTQFGIVILMVVLFLFNKEDLRSRLIRLAGKSDLNKTTEALDEAGGRLIKMFTAQILLNATTGALVMTALFFLGIPGAILWGVLTFVLRFIPYIGSMMAALLPVIIGASIGEGWTLAFVTAGTLIGIEIIVGQVLEPVFIGKMTGLSPVAIVASAAFWTALWGPIGLILATPMTIGLLVLGRNIQSLDFLEVLLGSEPVLTPDHALYQRLLASDVIEASELAEDYMRNNKIEGFLVDVAVPSLLLAHTDQQRGLISVERQTSVVTTFSQMLDELISVKETEDKPLNGLVLIAAPGVLNFGATLAFSAILTVKDIQHQMLPQDVMVPGKIHDFTNANIATVCLCYLAAPSDAKHNYSLRRLSRLLPGVNIFTVAWATSDNGIATQTPVGILPLLTGGGARNPASEIAEIAA